MGCYLYGRIRRTVFLPVGEEREDEVLERGYDSVDSSDDEERGLAYRYQGEASDSEEVSQPEGEVFFETGDLDWWRAGYGYEVMRFVLA